MFSIDTMLLPARANRVRTNALPPSVAAAMASSIVARVTDEKNVFATLIDYSASFAEYFEAVRVLVTGSSMGK